MSKYPAYFTLKGLLVRREGRVDQVIPWRDVEVINRRADIRKIDREVDPTLPRYVQLGQTCLARRLQIRQIRNDMRAGHHDMRWQCKAPWPETLILLLIMVLVAWVIIRPPGRPDNNPWRHEVLMGLPMWVKFERGVIIGLISISVVGLISFFTWLCWLGWRGYCRRVAARTTPLGVEISNQSGAVEFHEWKNCRKASMFIAPHRFTDFGRVPFIPRPREVWSAVWQAGRNERCVKDSQVTMSGLAIALLFILMNMLFIPMAAGMWIDNWPQKAVGLWVLLVINGFILFVSPMAKGIHWWHSSVNRKSYRKQRERGPHAAAYY